VRELEGEVKRLRDVLASKNCHNLPVAELIRAGLVASGRGAAGLEKEVERLKAEARATATRHEIALRSLRQEHERLRARREADELGRAAAASGNEGKIIPRALELHRQLESARTTHARRMRELEAKLEEERQGRVRAERELEALESPDRVMTRLANMESAHRRTLAALREREAEVVELQGIVGTTLRANVIHDVMRDNDAAGPAEPAPATEQQGQRTKQTPVRPQRGGRAAGGGNDDDDGHHHGSLPDPAAKPSPRATDPLPTPAKVATAAAVAALESRLAASEAARVGLEGALERIATAAQARPDPAPIIPAAAGAVTGAQSTDPVIESLLARHAKELRRQREAHEQQLREVTAGVGSAVRAASKAAFVILFFFLFLFFVLIFFLRVSNR
jgi:hypothetical protein